MAEGTRGRCFVSAAAIGPAGSVAVFPGMSMQSFHQNQGLEMLCSLTFREFGLRIVLKMGEMYPPVNYGL